LQALNYQAGQVIFQAGDASDCAYIIQRGRVEILRNAEEEQDHVGVLGAGSLFGEMGLIEGVKRVETAKALEDTVLEVISKEEFGQLYQNTCPQIQKLVQALTSKIQDLKKRNLPPVAQKPGAELAPVLAKMQESLERQCTLLEQQAGLSAPETLQSQRNTTLDQIDELGKLQPLLDDDSVNDILVNSTQGVFVERHGKLEKVSIQFDNEDEILHVAEGIVQKVNRTLDPHRPMVDARLIDGSRVNIIAHPLAVDGPSISIRKFSRRAITLDQMIEQGNVSPQLGEFLKILGKCKMNVLISGGTGSGKTTLLNAMSQYIGDEERVVTIEDAAELKMQQPHVVRLETKPLSTRGRPEDEVSMRDLVRNALRMRPDRIIVGEVRGPEAFDMMQAMNTGHEGSMSTIHANHPRDALARIENMIGMTNMNLSPAAIRSQIASALHVVVQVSRMRDNHRRIMYVTEVCGMEGDMVVMQDLFTFEVKGEGKGGKLDGVFQWSGIMPRTLRRMAYYGEYENLGKILKVKLPKL
jgi:pilus assembly protein CpaF